MMLTYFLTAFGHSRGHNSIDISPKVVCSMTRPFTTGSVTLKKALERRQYIT